MFPHVPSVRPAEPLFLSGAWPGVVLHGSRGHGIPLRDRPCRPGGVELRAHLRDSILSHVLVFHLLAILPLAAAGQGQQPSFSGCSHDRPLYSHGHGPDRKQFPCRRRTAAYDFGGRCQPAPLHPYCQGDNLGKKTHQRLPPPELLERRRFSLQIRGQCPVPPSCMDPAPVGGIPVRQQGAKCRR